MNPKIRRPIVLHGVRQNNLKNLHIEIPPRKITVVTGLSGSGKSSLAFDTLYAEGQRRYVESLSTYIRQFLDKMPRPEVDRVENIPPSIALEQRNTVVNSRSTVGTQTEIVDYLRVLFAKIGKMNCSACGGEVANIEIESIFDESLKWLHGKKAHIAAPLLYQNEFNDSLLRVVREQGYRRLLWKKSARIWESLDLEQLGQADFPKLPKSPELYIVTDRLSLLDETVEEDTRSRLFDSLNQAIAIGKGKILLHETGTAHTRNFNAGFACRKCGAQYKRPEPQLFSFNSPIGACERCSGFGYNLELDESLIVPDPSKTLKNGAIDPLSKPSLEDWQTELFRFAERHQLSIGKRYRELTPAQKKLIWEGEPSKKGSRTFPGIVGIFDLLAKKKYKLHVRVFIRRYQSQTLCKSCKGARLKTDALAVHIGDHTISSIQELSIQNATQWFHSLPLSASEIKITGEILQQVQKRLRLLNSVGVGYLSLSRLAKTLSGGEFQRINLATQLGNGLCGTLYVLDEPSIGLHAADTQKLIQILQELRDQGNTVVIVEHDLEVMRAADWLIELGPGAGRRGGELIAAGTAETLISTPGSLTGKYLSGAFSLHKERNPRPEPAKWLKITGCQENNLKNITVSIPLERWSIVTGVSGSGKSTLVHKTLFNALTHLEDRNTEGGTFERLYGAEYITGAVLLDQKPIGKSSRSNPATYLKAWDEVRRIYANQVLALRRGYTPQHFSFNVDGGRCPVCKGEGEIAVDMHFLAEIKLPCEECEGRRFKKTVLDIQYRGKNIHQLLNTTIDESYDLFRDHPILARKLGILRDVGLGYLQMGQSATTLSGGESQRLKIAATLDEKKSHHLLYIFDEPTTGLHLEDIKKLIQVIQDLVDAHNTVLMIEHHLDLIGQADWVIDLGPGGGSEGGYLLSAGPPATVVHAENSITGKILYQAGYRFESAPRGLTPSSNQ